MFRPVAEADGDDMKITKVLIENFRRIERLELDFTDTLDRVRPITVLVGANGCGKTSVLDAIGAALGQALDLPVQRPSLSLSPRRIVRKNASCARVACTVRFTSDEVRAAREINSAWMLRGRVPRADLPAERDAPVEASVVWTYPSPDRHATRGELTITPPHASVCFEARADAAKLMGARSRTDDWIRRVGQVVTIDQQRTLLSGRVSDVAWRGVTGAEVERGERVRTSDPRAMLLDLALKNALPRTENTDDAFERVRDGFNAICAPRTLVGAVNNEGEFDLLFNDGASEYGFDDIASGEEMVLLMLLKLAGDRIHRSVVLVDEVELHQHPVWQRRLVDALPKMGEDNQFILTTHSDYLLASFGPESVVKLGAPHVVKLAELDEDDDAP